MQDLATERALAARLAITVPVLSDHDTTVARAFGVYDLPGSMGAFSTHSFWLIDKDGIVRFHKVSLEMNVPFDEVRKAVATAQR